MTPATGPAAAVRRRRRLLIVLASMTVCLRPGFAAEPPSDRAAELAAAGDFAAAIEVVDQWLTQHPGDPRLYPMLVQVVATAPRSGTARALLEHYGRLLSAEQAGVLRAAPADWAELRGAVEQAITALEPGVPDAAERRQVLLLELGRSPSEPEVDPMVASVAVTAGAARYADWHQSDGIETRLRAAFTFAPDPEDGGTTGVIAGYGLVSLLATSGRNGEAHTVLEQLRERYPRSPEYALAAVELDAVAAGGSRWPRILPLPSPAMLLGALRLPAADLAGAAPSAPVVQLAPAAAAPIAPEEPAAQPKPGVRPAPVGVAEPPPRERVAAAAPGVRREPEPLAGHAAAPSPGSVTVATSSPVRPSFGRTRWTEPVESPAAEAVESSPTPAASRPHVGPITVSAVPDPAVYFVEVGRFHDSEKALGMARALRVVGYSAAVRERLQPDGAAMQVVAVSRNLTRGQAERLLMRLRTAGYDGQLNRRTLHEALRRPDRQG